MFLDVGDVVIADPRSAVVRTVGRSLAALMPEPGQSLPGPRGWRARGRGDHAGENLPGRLGHRRRLGRCGGGLRGLWRQPGRGPRRWGPMSRSVCWAGPGCAVWARSRPVTGTLPQLHLCWSIPVGFRPRRCSALSRPDNPPMPDPLLGISRDAGALIGFGEQPQRPASASHVADARNRHLP